MRYARPPEILFLTLVLFLFSSIFSPAVFAQEQDSSRTFFGIIIDPAVLFVSVSPGDTFKGQIKLTNDFQDGRIVHFEPLTANFKQHGNTGSPEFYFDEPGSNRIDPVNWAYFDETDYDIPFGETVVSNFTIAIPEDAEPGGHYLALLYSNKAEQEQNDVSLGKVISTLVFITVAGDIKESGELVDFRVERNFYVFPPALFSIGFKNTGNIHTRIAGDIFVHKGDLANPAQVIPVNQDSLLTLPGSTRIYYEQFTGGIITQENGKYRFNADQLTKIYFGKYTATLKTRYMSDGQKVVAEREVSFWVIPWPLILVVLVFLLMIFLVISMVRRKRRRASKGKESKQ